jgi:hypothetical protein
VTSRAPNPGNERAWPAIAIASSFGMLFLAFFAAFAIAVASCSKALDDAFGHVDVDVPPFDMVDESIQPIAVSPRACPSLQRVRDAAGGAAAVLYREMDPAHPGLEPDFEAQLDAALVTFDRALADAQPEVPVPLATTLQEVRDYVFLGRTQLVGSVDFISYLVNGGVLSGLRALNNADRLLADACGFSLVPSFEEPQP